MWYVGFLVFVCDCFLKGVFRIVGGCFVTILLLEILVGGSGCSFGLYGVVISTVLL